MLLKYLLRCIIIQERGVTMRKKVLEKMLMETEQKLNAVLHENEQLEERIKHAESLIGSDSKASLEKDELILSLKEENAKIKSESELALTQKDKIILDYELEINNLNKMLNDLKGEHYDTQKYAEDLKLRLDTIAAQENNESTEESKPRTFTAVPPKINKIESIEQTDPKLFDYASDIISKTILANAEIKGKLDSVEDTNKAELIALATGKTEILKSDVLQTLISDAETQDKMSAMDKVLEETIDYFNGLLGQVEL